VHSVYNERPLNSIELGRSTWPILHRMTLSYPEKPTDEHKEKVSKFINLFSKTYPCKYCANDF
jgi:FAD-linked sulfhydryl oxidase